MTNKILIAALLVVTTSIVAAAQNTNSSTTTRSAQPNTNQATPAPTRPATDTAKPAATTKPTPKAADPKPVMAKPAAPKPAPAKPVPPKPAVVTPAVPGSTAVVNAFNNLVEGIKLADVNAVTAVYLNSPRLVLFNNNGTVTKGWDQMRKNRESSYPDVKDVKLEVRDVSVTMLGRDGAVVSCLWTQSQTYKGTPETASGRMTLVFQRRGTEWKAVHLHTSPDKEDPTRVLKSEQASPTPTPGPPPPPQDR
jgi:ketosteroid isomerase-like protein